MHSLTTQSPAEALPVIERTLAAVRGRGERTWEPELLRVYAEARFRCATDLESVDGLLGEAVNSARSTGARTQELHAAMSRLRIGAGDRAAARLALAVAIGAITQVTDDADMVEARAWLGPR